MTAGAADDRPSGGASVSGGFIAGFLIAQVGAYVSFLPLLSILVPLQAAALLPSGKAELVSRIALLGAGVAAVANLGVGWASDHTRGRFGRRRPWIIGGAAATAASYALIAAARTPQALLFAVLAFQFAFNIAFAPLVALIPDRVPDRQKGWVAALASLGLPLGTVIGSVLIGLILSGRGERYGALAVIVVATLIPFAALIRDPPSEAPVRRSGGRWPRFTTDFLFVWIGRSLVLTAFSLSQIYLLFYLQDTMGYGTLRRGAPEADMARLALVFGAANGLAGLAAGHASDRLGKRKIFVIAGALVLGLALAGLALARGWWLTAASYGVLGLGAGVYFAVDLALIAQVLPSARDAGRDLGVINLSNTLPQIAAPALAGLLMTAPGADIRWVFALAAILAALGALMVTPIRQVR